MRFFLITLPLFACVCLSRAQESGWIIILSNHHAIDSLTINGVSGDTLRTVRNGVPIMLSINELAEMQEPHRPKLLSGALLGGIVGFVACELTFELAQARGAVSDHGITMFPPFFVDSYYHIAFDVSGFLAGMTIGGLVGLTLNKDNVYEFRNLAHREKIDLLESILENEENPYLE